MADSFGAPLDYVGRAALDLTLLDAGRLATALGTGGFKLSNTRVHQNLVLYHLGSSMHCSTIFLREASHMVGSPFRPTELQEISWGDLQWAELQCSVDVPVVREEVVEDEVTRVVTTVVLPNQAESSNEGSEGSPGST